MNGSLASGPLKLYADSGLLLYRDCRNIGLPCRPILNVDKYIPDLRRRRVDDDLGQRLYWCAVVYGALTGEALVS